MFVRQLRRTALVWVALAALTTGCFALQEAEQASGPVVAPTIAVAQPTAAPPTAAPTAAPTTAAAEPTAPAATAPTETPAPAEAATPAPPAATGAPTIFTIDPDQSTARFLLDEVLRGADFQVVGVTSNLGGQLAFNPADPTSAQVGPIVINARSFVTDNEFRNNAIRNEVLRTNQYELITFTPTALNGLPTAVVFGETYTLQIIGDLELVGQSRSVTFEATVTPISATELRGSAQAEIAYGDWGVTVPLSRSVTAVAPTLTMVLEFTALAQ